MRINIEIPLPSRVGQKGSNSTNAPPALVKLSPSGELVLIELQGSLEIDDAHPEGGQALGKLEFHEGLEDKPTLLISHHRLEGKVVALTKPFAVLEKKKRVVRKQGTDVRSAGMASSPLLSSRAINDIHDRYDDDEEDEGAEVGSPSMSRKRAKFAHQTPMKPLDRVSEVVNSSPMPRAPMRGSELDFSSPVLASRYNTTATIKDDAQGFASDFMHRKDTATYFEVVCIIRKKILFTKRPEPVVRLDGEGGDAARKALGL